jgi:hypothetical protein
MQRRYVSDVVLGDVARDLFGTEQLSDRLIEADHSVVANFADEDHMGILPQTVFEAVGETIDIDTELPLSEY